MNPLPATSGPLVPRKRQPRPRMRRGEGRLSICGRPLQARENVGIVAARGRMLSSVRPLMRQEDSRRPVWEFADQVQITRSVLEALWKALVVPAPSRRLLRHTLLPLTPTPSRSWSAYATIIGALYTPPLTSRAQMIRAILLARATVTSIFGLRANICASHDPLGAPRRLAC
jgi:hypothetical protein